MKLISQKDLTNYFNKNQPPSKGVKYKNYENTIRLNINENTEIKIDNSSSFKDFQMTKVENQRAKNLEIQIDSNGNGICINQIWLFGLGM